MTDQDALQSLLSEIDTILKTELSPYRRPFFEGARHYLTALKQMSEDSGEVKVRRKRKAPEEEKGESRES